MRYIQKFLTHVWRKPSLYFFVFLCIWSVDRHHRLEYHPDPAGGPFHSDVFEYYRYLPDIFIHDEALRNETFPENKRTIGMAILYAPWFFIGHYCTLLDGTFEPNGYTFYYQWAIRWSTIIFTIIGLFFTRRILLNYFSEWVTLVTLIGLLFGTNLFFYTYGWGGMPHAYLFSLTACYLFAVIRWHQKQQYVYLWMALFIAGFCVLIRPTAILILIFLFLYGVSGINDLKKNLRLMTRSKPGLIAGIIVFVLPLLLQSIFWWIYNDSLIYYSYGKERFFFDDPQIRNFLISWRKGWLVYTPIMIFGVAGLFSFRPKAKQLSVSTWIYLIATIYIYSSWWDWAFGGSFGCRVLIDSYAILAIPFALSIDKTATCLMKGSIVKRILAVFAAAFFCFCIHLNLVQSWQYRATIMHWSGMTAEAYKFIFLKKHLTNAEFRKMETLIHVPPPEKMIAGERDE